MSGRGCAIIRLHLLERVVAQVGDAGQAKPHLEHNPLSPFGACHATPIRKLNDPDMQDILRALDTLTNDGLEAIIDRAEAILRERLAHVPLRDDPAVGIWADREDMKDSAAWVRKLRQGGVSDDRD